MSERSRVAAFSRNPNAALRRVSTSSVWIKRRSRSLVRARGTKRRRRSLIRAQGWSSRQHWEFHKQCNSNAESVRQSSQVAQIRQRFQRLTSLLYELTQG